MTHHRLTYSGLVALGAALAGCSNTQRTAVRPTGEWHLVAGKSSTGVVTPIAWTMIIDISERRGDSLLGRYLVAPRPDSAPDAVIQAQMRGILSPRNHLSLVALVPDSSALDNLIEAEISNDTLFVSSYRPRSGDNKLRPGSKLVFIKQQ